MSADTEPLPLDRLGRPPRILLIRTSALGDVVHCLPTLGALTREHPQASLAWVVEAPFAPVLSGHPALDRVIRVRLREWRDRPFRPRTLKEIGRFLREMRSFRPDVALDLMGNHKAGVVARLSGARWRVGARRSDRREPSSALWINRAVGLRGDHVVERTATLLRALGLRDPELGFDPSAIGETDEPEAGPKAASAPILVQPGAGWANKEYPPERWGRIAATIAAETDRPVGVLAGPGEVPLADRVVSSSGGRARRLSPRGIEELIATLRRARLVLGGDTGPVHLAHALGVPVLALHGPTSPNRHGPWRARERALWKKLPCSFCYRRFDGVKACLLEIPPDTVARRALEILEAIPDRESGPD